MEIWKPIIEYEQLYKISNMGRIKSLTCFVKCRAGLRKRVGRIVKIQLNKSGYPVVGLSKDNKLVHKRVSRLVAIHFIPNPKNKPQVNHKKGNKLDNRHFMLEWSTISENVKHAWKTGLNQGRRQIKKPLCFDYL